MDDPEDEEEGKGVEMVELGWRSFEMGVVVEDGEVELGGRRTWDDSMVGLFELGPASGEGG